MANLFLDANDLNIHVSNPMKVYGSTGTESVLIDANTTGVVLDQNVERVDLPGAASAFTYQQAGNQLKVYSGATLVATVPLQGDADGTQVVFTNGSVHATLVGGVMTLGGATVSTTTGAVTPTTIDTAITSGSSTGAAATPTFSVAGASSVTEGNTATFTVTLSAAQGTAKTVAFALEGTGGAVLGTDTGAATPGTTGTLTFAPGEVTKTITVPVTFDSTTETGEGLKVTLSSPSTGTALGTATASTTIADPTAPTFTLTSNVTPGASTEEGNTITYTITPSGVTDKAYTFTLSTIGDTLSGVATAASATDFSPASQTITFAAGTTTPQTVVQTIVNDGVTEGLEGYKTSLLDTSYASISSVTGTINDPITSNVGTTYTFTTGIDNIAGTNGNDTIIGDWTATATINAADHINGGSGTDTVKFYGTPGTFPATMSNIEILDIVTAANAALNVSAVTGGFTKLIIEDASAINAQTVTTGTSVSTLQLATAAGAATTGTVTWAGSATATSLNLALNGYQYQLGATPAALTITGAMATTLNIDSIGNTNKIGTFTGPTTVTSHVVTGDKGLTYALAAADAAALNSINASANTGGVNVDVSAAANKAGFTFTGGSGDDSIKLSDNQLGTLTAGSQLAGGAGTGDKLGILDTAPLTTAEYAKINATTGFEILGINTALTTDASQLTSIKHFSLDTNANQAFTSLATGSIIDFTVAHAGTTGIGMAVGVNDVTINVGKATAAGITVGGPVTVGATSIALTSNGLSANSLNLVNADNSVITLTGSADLTLSATLSATSTGSKVDASAFTGALTMTGSTKADILIGGAKADVFNASTGADQITGGAGADTFKFTTDATVDTTNIHTIKDFQTNVDLLVLKDMGGEVISTTKVDVSAASSLSAAIDLCMTGNGSVNGIVKWFQYGGNTYITEDCNVAETYTVGSDIVVKLAGTIDLSTTDLGGHLTFA